MHHPPYVEVLSRRSVTNFEALMQTPSQELTARVLVVDDDAPARQLVRKYLVSRGAVVFEAENPYFALGRLSDADIDLVITDLNMPGRSG
ncbi:MAG TPA: response regulator, partial [Longimicrobiales bacterium]